MFSFIKKTAEWYVDTMRFYNTVYELSELSDKELNELGLARSEIPFVAMNKFGDKHDFALYITHVLTRHK